jgi:hypothetical protein
MSDDAELPSEAPRTLVDPVPTYLPAEVAAPAPRVRWGRAAALQIVAGGIAGFAVPFCFYVLPQGPLFGEIGLVGQAIWIGVFIVSAAFVALVGAGIPLLVAWRSWLVVSRRRRGLRREVLAVVLGAIGGSLIPSVLPFVVMAAAGASWTLYVVTVLALGGIPGVAFALWVAAAWRRARTAGLTSRADAANVDTAHIDVRRSPP